MPRVRLLHWNAAEAARYLALLRNLKYRVDYQEQFESALMKQWRKSPPDAFVIDLSRLPSHGREIAVALRQSPSTRPVPIVFCGGAEDKVSGVRRLLHDAAYCTFENLPASLKGALEERSLHPLKPPVKPPAMMERYAGRTAAQKLGITGSSTVSLIDPPPNVHSVLGELPAGAEVLADTAGRAAVTLVFVHRPDLLASTLSSLRSRAVQTKLWLLWRKGGSAARGDITERLVRETGLDLGLVDYKICSVDSTWTAMLFARKK